MHLHFNEVCNDEAIVCIENLAGNLPSYLGCDNKVPCLREMEMYQAERLDEVWQFQQEGSHDV